IERIVQKNEKVNRLVKGEPSVIIKDGVINMTELTNNHIEMEQLREILRQQECFFLENDKHVILENAGQMSVLKKSDAAKALSILLV
ncbi:YetF domain-containing protein, partial [Enterococcus faecium]|uniref:YetF domain-containing protein n=1 Tax=Enterococcus faecium TaxID=1352 RepID=UPI0010C21CDD